MCEAENICRICLDTHFLTDIFSDEAAPALADRIAYCASVQLSPEDPLPKKICRRCTFYLNVAYVFRSVCEWADTLLQRKEQRFDALDRMLILKKFGLDAFIHTKGVHLIDLILAEHETGDFCRSIPPSCSEESNFELPNEALFTTDVENKKQSVRNTTGEDFEDEEHSLLNDGDPFLLRGDEASSQKLTHLSCIALDDFENFEREQVSVQYVADSVNKKSDKDVEAENCVLIVQASDRVGRHIAKKNSGQPPKRYSQVVTTKQGLMQKVILDDPKIFDEIEEPLVADEVNTITEQEYILENDLSIPEPIFEETIITNSYNNDEQGCLTNNEVKLTIVKGENKNVDSRVDIKNKYNLRHKLQNCSKEDNDDSNNDCGYYDVINNCEASQQKTKNPNMVCKVCNKAFPFPSHLVRHLRAHVGVKRFTCRYCSKQFLHRYNLTVHLRKHTGNFPLRCSFCSRGFTSPSVLERHKRSHTGETPFKCQYCSQLFSHASSLNVHEKMHFNKPSFRCDICCKVFSYKSSLTVHKRGHSGLKPHRCGVCSKNFTRKTSLMRHMLCHTSKFECQSCGMAFSSRILLKRHYKLH